MAKKSEYIDIECVDVIDERTIVEVGELFEYYQYDTTKTEYRGIHDVITGRTVSFPEVQIEYDMDVANDRKNIISKKSNEINIYGNVEEKNQYCYYLNTLNLLVHSSKTVKSEYKDPYILVLGKDLNSLRAYVFSGNQVVKIFSGVWFSDPIIPFVGKTVFKIKECSIPLRMVYDSVSEKNVVMRVVYA
jgi:hypothetical protein